MGLFDTLQAPPGLNLGITSDGGATYFLPSRINHWALTSGPVQGNYARVEGETSFGQCYSVSDVWLNQNGSLTFRLVYFGPTAAGTAQRINCAPGSTADIVFPRVI